MDLQMPIMAGEEALVRIRAEEAGSSRVRVFALTAGAQQSDLNHLLLAGFDGYLSKPLDVDQLFALFGRLCPEKHTKNTISEKKVAVQRDNPSDCQGSVHPGIALEAGIARLDGGGGFYFKYVFSLKVFEFVPKS